MLTSSNPAMDGLQAPSRPVNRCCKACRISKVKCDLLKKAPGAPCSRCARLNLACVREARGNLSTGDVRLSAPGVCELKLYPQAGKRAGSHSARTGSQVAKEIELIKRTVLTTLTPHPAQSRAMLRWCSRVAWTTNDTSLMAWVMVQASRQGLPLCDFAPRLPIPRPQLEPPNSLPPYCRELFGGSGLAVAFVSLDGNVFWLANDAFDELACSRSALQDSRLQPTCEVSALFSHY